METQVFSPPIFGPPILAVATEPADRPTAFALILDLSSQAMYGENHVIDLFKSSLVTCFSNMQYDNVLYFAGNWHEDPGSAVAAIHGYSPPVRNLSELITDVLKSFATLDRFYRRKVLLLTDQFSVCDVHPMNIAVSRNAAKLLDISFYAMAYGPQYARVISECGWEFHHSDEPTEIDSILMEVCK